MTAGGYHNVKHDPAALVRPWAGCPFREPLIGERRARRGAQVFFARSHAALAQLVEHIIRNDGVRCSSHLSGTTLFEGISLLVEKLSSPPSQLL